jgi:hypothetical protein
MVNSDIVLTLEDHFKKALRYEINLTCIKIYQT